MRVAFCSVFLEKPTTQFIEALEACLPAIEKEGWAHSLFTEVGSPYISNARSTALRKALDWKPDCVVFLDYDVSWTPEAMVKFLSIEDDVVAGTYRFKCPDEKYMGKMKVGEDGNLVVRKDGCIQAEHVPAGFLKISKKGLQHFAMTYPELLFGDPLGYSLDLFNHGVMEHCWYGEDYAFSKRWTDSGGEIWIVPDLDIAHSSSKETYNGNLHRYLLNYNKPKPILSNPLVSIIITCYNYAHFLPDAIESAQLQTYDNLEILVINNGSPDNTSEVASKYLDDPRVRLIEVSTNGGIASGRNIGAREASGEWLIMLDADDKLKPKYVEECLQIADADIIGTEVLEFGNSHNHYEVRAEPSYYDFIAGNQVNCGAMFRKTIWEAVGGYDEDNRIGYEDWDFWISATKMGYEVKNVKKPLFLYRKHGKSMIDSTIEKKDSIIEYIGNKHGIKIGGSK